MKDPTVTGVNPGDKTGATVHLLSTNSNYIGFRSCHDDNRRLYECDIHRCHVTCHYRRSCHDHSRRNLRTFHLYSFPQNSINILMKSLKLTTGPGNPCSGVGMEANGQTAIAEMRSPLEATNGLALDGLTVFNHVVPFYYHSI